MHFLIIDDHPIIRQSLGLALRAHFPEAGLTEADSAKAAVARFPEKKWAVILLDLDLPDRSGIDLLRDARALAPASPVLVFSGRNEAEYGRRVLAAGAMGFLSKMSTPAQIETAVRRVLAGHKHISPDLAEQLVGSPSAAAVLHEALSDRELEVLRLIAAGLSPTDAAARLGLSIKTVSTYRARILEKLGLRTTADLIRYAVDHHIAG
jgi:two-component system, NarL family, invasion response regulator UvrY